MGTTQLWLHRLAFGILAIGLALSSGWFLLGPDWRLVIASNANWTSGLGDRDGEFETRKAFCKAVQAAIDAE